MNDAGYVVKGGQRLRRGYTTGTCAAAAARAAAAMLLTGETVSQVRIRTPKGPVLDMEIEDIRRSPEAVSCAVRKDSGDDPDVTNHALIYARVGWSDEPGVRIEGGEGVGRVTKPGLDQPVGAAAINSTPRRMIREAVLEAAAEAVRTGAGKAAAEAGRPGTGQADGEDADRVPESVPAGPGGAGADKTPRGFDVTISVPLGRELAAKTFNPRLGIEGGISILGTSGIVEPMSDRALLETIRTEIRVRSCEGYPVLAAAPGNYGRNFFLETYGFSLDTAVTSSNFIYDTVRMAAEAGFEKLLFIGHIGKLVKVAGGVRNTHSQYGDRRMEILSSITRDCMLKAAMAQKDSSPEAEDPGRGPVKGKTPEAAVPELPERKTPEAAVPELPERKAPEAAGPGLSEKKTPEAAGAGACSGEAEESVLTRLADCVATDEAVRILKECGLDKPVLAEMTLRIREVMETWAEGKMQVEVIVFSNVWGELGRTDRALDYMQVIRGYSSRPLEGREHVTLRSAIPMRLRAAERR